ncbi:MAG: histidinol dehydrogenase [Gemmataceae bacterium]
MAMMNMRRIDGLAGDASAELRAWQQRINAQGEIVSPRSRQLTQTVFGEPLSPQQVVERICADVRQRGQEAVLHYTEQLDGARLTADTLRVSYEELAQAHRNIDAAFLQTIRRVRHNIMSFQAGLLLRDASLRVEGSHELRLRYRPMRRVGVCIPGGAAAYPSTLLMTIVPAQAAGVREIAVVMPPTANGAYNQDLLAVCHELGVTEVYRVGGAQAVAALAYGIETLKPVDMIVGPGNLFVSLAKRHVFGQVAIDCIAGPSEVVVVADDTALPEYVAADLIAQAEHHPGVSILVSWERTLFDEVAEHLERQLADLPRGDLARDSLEHFGLFVMTRDVSQAVECVNLLAPEHLHVETRDADALADLLHAGAIFLGHHTPVALGDYVAGPSHVLPTGGTARFSSGLCANDFLRRASVLRFTAAGLEAVADDVCLLAEKEGLTGHAASVATRVRPTFPHHPQLANEPASSLTTDT